MKQGTIAAIDICLQSEQSSLSDAELIVTYHHILSDHNIPAQHQEIVNFLEDMDIQLDSHHLDALYTTIFGALEIQNDSPLGGPIMLKIVFCVDYKQQKAEERLRDGR